MNSTLVSESLTKSLSNFFPSLIASSILLLIGWVIGKTLGIITEEILKRSKIDEYIFKTKKPTISLSKTTSIVISWSIYLIFIQAAVEVLGIKVLVTAIGMLVDFLPRLIGAVYILIGGYAFGKYVKAKLFADSEFEFNILASKVAYSVVLYISIAMALSLIGIDVFVLNALLLIFAASFAIAFGIGLGFVMQDLMKEKLIKKSKRKRPKHPS